MPWYQVAAIVLSGIAALFTVIKFVSAGFRTAVDGVMDQQMREVNRSIDELDKQNAHRFASVDNSLGSLEDKLNVIHAQFHPNGGQSHADRLAQLTDRVASIADKLDRMSGA